MSTTLIERTRQYHEDIEIGEKVASRLLLERSKRKPKFRPIYDHAIQETLLNIQEASKRVLEIYADKDELRAEEIAIFGGLKRFNSEVDHAATVSNENETTSNDDCRVVWQNFYDQLKVIKDFHQAHTTPSGGGNPISMAHTSDDVAVLASEAIERCNVLKLFSSEESLGRRVDMENLFLEYTNLSKLRKHRQKDMINAEIARLRKKMNTKKQSENNLKPSSASTEPIGETETSLTQTNISDTLENIGATIVVQEIDYITYLKVFDDFRSIPRHCKYRDPEYEAYIDHLLNYLKVFFQKINPLSNNLKLMSHLKTQFCNAWASQSISGWETPTHRMAFYCFPADRLFTSASILKSYCQGKKYKKELSLLQQLSMGEQKKKQDESEIYDKLLAEKEYYIQRFKEILGHIIQFTIEHLQKKQSRTLRELELENQEDSDEEEKNALVVIHQPVEAKLQSDSDEDGDDAEKPVYNPLNLPLGWDGKPIPFWLYKLHGLGVEFKCEICGNYSYWGRRAFERHFQEWRHAFGMRCLKIPNTVHFKEITKIEDAVLLYDQLKKEAELQTFKADQDVECEDIEGNVMSARAFEDMQRQGLI